MEAILLAGVMLAAIVIGYFAAVRFTAFLTENVHDHRDEPASDGFRLPETDANPAESVLREERKAPDALPSDAGYRITISRSDSVTGNESHPKKD